MSILSKLIAKAFPPQPPALRFEVIFTYRERVQVSQFVSLPNGPLAMQRGEVVKWSEVPGLATSLMNRGRGSVFGHFSDGTRKEVATIRVDGDKVTYEWTTTWRPPQERS
ncbi:hypothetical protein [Rhizobium sp. BK176]|uniref:hypothetical protein n=1 Tax=Rhizobium sp. BK176 TaxID=2587071 RepID=UPI0021678675|nr:hypothetical protein [Rhizobium sp. BK176]MCS4088605.1 hypothetical protein [Rhizobium sp. BK176]